METIQYWGSANFQEYPYTGRIVTWIYGEKQTVSDSLATILLAASSDFHIDSESQGGEAAIWNPTGTALVGPDGAAAIIIPRNAESYDVTPDGVALYDVSTTNSATCVVQSASGAFKPGDVGKCCAVHTRVSTAALGSARYGTIVSVQSPTQCTASLNLAPGALTSAMFVYGTDNAATIQAAINAAIASVDKVLKLPAGIICSSAGITAGGNIIIEGAGRSYTEKEWYDFDYAGTSLVICGYNATSSFYAGNNTTGPRLYGFNIDGMGISPKVLYLNGRAAYCSDLTVLKPAGGGVNSHAFLAGPGSMVDHCTFVGGYNCFPVACNGDAQITSCNIYGTGTGYYAIKAGANSDLIISNNHVWAPGTGLFNAGSVLIEAWNTSADQDSVLISGNQFDTAQNAPHIQIDVQAGCTLRGVNIVGNNSFNNDSVTTPYPWLDINVNATGYLRGLMVTSNMVEGSWQTATAGVHSCLIDGAGIAGALHGATVMGNFIDRPSVGGFTSFTPSHSSGNIRVDGAGAATVF